MEEVEEEAENLPPLSKAEIARSSMSTAEAKKHLSKNCQALDEGDLSEEELDLPTVNATVEAQVQEWISAEGSS